MFNNEWYFLLALRKSCCDIINKVSIIIIACKQNSLSRARFGEAVNIVFDTPIHPWWLACYKSVKKVIRPVKIDVFFNHTVCLSRCSNNLKMKLFLKPVGRMSKPLHFWATVSRYSFCSSFKPEIWVKRCKEFLKHVKSCLEFNICKLCIARRLPRCRQKLCKFKVVVKICQISISKLSTIHDLTNQIMIADSGTMEQWHQ